MALWDPRVHLQAAVGRTCVNTFPCRAQEEAMERGVHCATWGFLSGWDVQLLQELPGS